MKVEQKHPGGVMSLTDQIFRLAEPVIVKIDGRDVALSLRDASLLSTRLADAVQSVRQAERMRRGEGNAFCVPLLAPPGAGMSLLHSKLA